MFLSPLFQRAKVRSALVDDMVAAIPEDAQRYADPAGRRASQAALLVFVGPVADKLEMFRGKQRSRGDPVE